MTTPGEPQEPSWAPPADNEEAVESGAIIRSPAASPGAQDSAEQTRWPWEAESDGHSTPPKTSTGPTIRTDELYRNHPEDRNSSATSPADGISSTASNTGITPTNQPNAVTIPPMTAAYAVDAGTANASPIETQDKSERGLGTWGVFFVVAGITTVVGLVDMTVNREFTWFTGAAFVAASVLGALMVRSRDLWTAVITPPIAFLVALLIAGQPTTISGSGSLIIREVSLVGTGLAFNAPFIFGGTAAALVIVLIRRAKLGKR